jgi:hypothetical protein
MRLSLKMKTLLWRAAIVDRKSGETPGVAPRLLSERHRLYQAQSGLILHPKRLWGRVRSFRFLYALAANGVIRRLEQSGIFQRTGSG